MKQSYRRQFFRNKDGVEEIAYVDFSRRQKKEDQPILHLISYDETLFAEKDSFCILENTSNGGEWSFYFITEGEGVMQCGSQKIPLTSGKVFLNRHTRELVIRNTASSPFRKRSISILSSYFLEAFFGPFYGDFESELFQVRSPERVSGFLDKVHTLVKEGGEYLYDELSILIYSFLQELSRRKHPEQLSLKTRVTDAVKRSPESYGNIESLMSLCDLSRQGLFRFFEKTFHKSPMEYVILARLEKSKWYLNCRPDLSIEEIAHICGYQSAAFFARSFKKHFGFTPGKFRSELYDKRIFSFGDRKD